MLTEEEVVKVKEKRIPKKSKKPEKKVESSDDHADWRYENAAVVVYSPNFRSHWLINFAPR